MNVSGSQKNEESPRVDFSDWTKEQGGSFDISFRLGLQGAILVGQKKYDVLFRSTIY
jgi:hypothetical protein